MSGAAVFSSGSFCACRRLNQSRPSVSYLSQSAHSLRASRAGHALAARDREVRLGENRRKRVIGRARLSDNPGDETPQTSVEPSEVKSEFSPPPPLEQNTIVWSRQKITTAVALSLGAVVATVFAITSHSAVAAGSGTLSLLTKSGIPAAFSIIVLSELGDKTFFIAALLAAKRNKWVVLGGSVGALGIMTIISVIIGRVFTQVPAALTSSLPVKEYIAAALLVFFGVRTLKEALSQEGETGDMVDENQDEGELGDAKVAVREFEQKSSDSGNAWRVFSEVFGLIFVAEWGDRSMLATVALGATQNPFGVCTGAIAGHALATAIAVLGGGLLSRWVSERTLGIVGGVCFLVFAGATAAGAF